MGIFGSRLSSHERLATLLALCYKHPVEHNITSNAEARPSTINKELGADISRHPTCKLKNSRCGFLNIGLHPPEHQPTKSLPPSQASTLSVLPCLTPRDLEPAQSSGKACSLSCTRNSWPKTPKPSFLPLMPPCKRSPRRRLYSCNRQPHPRQRTQTTPS